ncbi:hypothetical protein L596_027028 [Steinernema carpocapsae]|uniref:Transmembrane protein n=1 Tax=Steinernema carpocapsae TaxID=34508 RepID=A0A4U5M409_STECR|nr:hypothetical protein L596_027028 [Steinernema carpocapsae]
MNSCIAFRLSETVPYLSEIRVSDRVSPRFATFCLLRPLNNSGLSIFSVSCTLLLFILLTRFYFCALTARIPLFGCLNRPQLLLLCCCSQLRVTPLFLLPVCVLFVQPVLPWRAATGC